jgi:hypothetical protein
MELVVIFSNQNGAILSMTFEGAWDWMEWRDENWKDFEFWGSKLLKVW